MNSGEVLKAIAKIRTNIIDQDPETLARALQGFVIEGSKRHKINTDDLTLSVFKSDKDTFTKAGAETADLMTILLKAGTCFFDALLYLSIEEKRRPEVKYIDDPTNITPAGDHGPKGDPSKITSFIFFTYFYILVRGHAPSQSSAYDGQAVPAFLKNVLAINENPKVVAKYLASFDLNKMDPEWVSHIQTTHLGREAQTRLGLGVAGYRICSVFNYYKPDMKDIDDYADAIKVAKSFLDAGLDWSFHPATREASLLTKYGNINKNCTNLITLVFTEDTIKKMLAAKKLAVTPVFDAAHTNYTTWSEPYVAKRPIFKKT